MVSYQLSIPDEPSARRALAGAICALAFEYNWEQNGAGTPAEYAAAFADVCSSFQPLIPTGDNVELLVNIRAASQANFLASTWYLWQMLTVDLGNSVDWNFSTHTFTAPEDGNYLAEWRYGRQTAQGAVAWDFRVNGSSHTLKSVPETYYTGYAQGMTTIPLSSGDTVQVWLYLEGLNGYLLNNAPHYTGLKIWRLGDL